MSNVSDLLAASRAGHAQYRRCIHERNLVAARVAVAGARDLRHQAHAADPTHTDPAWALDRATHDELMTFYEDYLTRVDAR